MAESRTFAQMIETGRVPVHEAVRVIRAAAEAIGRAHDSGVVHGDLKGSNVVVTPNGEVEITDLGAGTASEASPGDDVCALAALLLEVLAMSSGSQSSAGPAEPTHKVRIERNVDPVVAAMLGSLSRAPERLRTAQDFAAELEKAALRMRSEETAELPPAPPDASIPIVLPDLVGRIIAGRYRIEDVVGRGSTSIVYRARHLELASCVAIKVLSPAGADVADEAMHDRFEFEAQVLASMRHPNVITIFDLGTTEDGLRYIVMELLQGETLAALLRREPRLSPSAAVSIACQVAEALAALHERGLIHRDVKPANLFVTGDNVEQRVIKLMDFGLVRALCGAAPASTGPRRRLQTQAGVILGTGAYMSPELIQGQRLDARSDVYALGVVTYRLLTGTLPFEDADMPILLARHITEPVERLTWRAPDAEIPAALEQAVLRALAKAPEGRPATARVFADELRTALATRTDSRPPVSTLSATALPAELLSEPQRRRRAARWMTAALVLPAAVLAVFAIAGRSVSSRAEAAPDVRPLAALSATARPRSGPEATQARPANPRRDSDKRHIGRRAVGRAERVAAAPAMTTQPAAGPKPARIEDDLRAPSWGLGAKR